jgi:predicted nucleic acid-binding protein
MRETGPCRWGFSGALLGFDAVADFDGAVRIYRRCRAAGVTPRGMIDCMIAAVAWRRGATLLAHDADMDRVARVVEIELDDASLRA